MKTRIVISFLAVIFSFVACNNSKKDNKENTETPESQIEKNIEADPIHTSQNSLDWNGVYEGVIPCADCPGIQMTITLNNDESFQLEMEYLERDSKLKYEGKFSWFDNGSKIELHPENKKEENMKFFVGENQLIQLNAEGQRAEGEMADEYILRKSEVTK